MVAGPLFLLPYRKFNDVLDGATFGARARSHSCGAELLSTRTSSSASGVRPVGDAVLWTCGCLSLGIESRCSPLAGSAAPGALWLRYRAPVARPQRLGGLGNPLSRCRWRLG